MIARNSLIVLLNTVFGALLGFAALKLIAYYMGAGVIGQLDFALGLVTLLSFVTDMGFHTSHVKKVSEGLALEEALGFILWFKLLTTLVFLGLGAAFVSFGLFVQPQVLEDVSIPTLIFFLAYQAVRGVQAVGILTFDGLREIPKSQIALLIENGVRVILSLLLALAYAAAVYDAGPLRGTFLARALSLWLSGDPSSALALAALGGILASAGIAMYYFRKLPVRPVFPKRETWTSYWQFAKPIFLLYAVGFFSAQLDRIIVGFFWKDVDVGLLGGASRIAQLVTLASGALGAVLFPYISELHARAEKEKLAKSIELSIRYNSMVILPFAIFVMLFSGPLIRILLAGPFDAAQSTLSLLALSTLLHGLMIPIGVTLVAMGHSRVAAHVGLQISVTTIVGNLLLVPGATSLYRGWGLSYVGVAWTSLLANTVAIGIYLYYANKHWTVRPYKSVPLHLGAAVAANGIAFWIFGAYFGYTRELGVATLGALGMLVLATYLGILVAVREFRRSDFLFFRDLFSPSKLGRHLKEELGK